jgi:DnaJ like chaperone protein
VSLPIVLLLTLAAAAIADSPAQSYQWVDENGVVHATSNREEIPEAYRDAATPTATFPNEDGERTAFSWVDESGVHHFTDRPGAIPKDYRDRVSTRTVHTAPPSDPEAGGWRETMQRSLSSGLARLLPGASTTAIWPFAAGAAVVVLLFITVLAHRRRGSRASLPPQTEDEVPHSSTAPPLEHIYPAELELCYEILGIKPGALEQEVKEAYRERMLEYHPDRVSNLGEELQALAEEKSKAINEAYRRILDRGAR